MLNTHSFKKSKYVRRVLLKKCPLTHSSHQVLPPRGNSVNSSQYYPMGFFCVYADMHMY